jgi:hypothetical protein
LAVLLCVAPYSATTVEVPAGRRQSTKEVPRTPVPCAARVQTCGLPLYRTRAAAAIRSRRRRRRHTEPQPQPQAVRSRSRKPYGATAASRTVDPPPPQAIRSRRTVDPHGAAPSYSSRRRRRRQHTVFGELTTDPNVKRLRVDLINRRPPHPTPEAIAKFSSSFFEQRATFWIRTEPRAAVV